MVGVAGLVQHLSRQMDAVQTVGVAPAAGEGAFRREWSIVVSPPLIHEMALGPGRTGEFLALNSGKVQRFDASGTRLGQFEAPSKSSRIATDPTGAVPYLFIVSSAAKWTGAIDHTVATDYFLQALDTNGKEVWKTRFDPKEVASLEPSVVMLNSRPVIILSASQRILAVDPQGSQLWSLSLWHHPGTVTASDLSGDGANTLLAAVAPLKEIVRIDGDGEIQGKWGSGDGPSRLRAMRTGGRACAVSLRQVFGRGQGVRHALAFFDASGAVVTEVELPPDSHHLSYWPIVPLDIDGSGRRNWAIGLGDGTILVFSPDGEELARHATGERLRTILTLPQPGGPDLLVAATHRGLSAWRPVPDRMRGPR
jgi:hypothetical protein